MKSLPGGSPKETSLQEMAEWYREIHATRDILKQLVHFLLASFGTRWHVTQLSRWWGEDWMSGGHSKRCHIIRFLEWMSLAAVQPISHVTSLSFTCLLSLFISFLLLSVQHHISLYGVKNVIKIKSEFMLNRMTK